MASISSITSGESFFNVSIAERLSRNCSSRLAPKMAVLTFGFLMHHAMASEAMLTPNDFRVSERAFPFCKMLFAHPAFLQPFHSLQRKAAFLGQSLVVFSGEQSARQRTPNGKSQPRIFI